MAKGKPWHYVGIDAFSLFKRFLMEDGPNALVKPWLKEQRAIASAGGYDGPIVARVFRYAAQPNSFALDPWAYARKSDGQFPLLTDFVNLCADEGFYVDLTCGDSQICLPEPGLQQEHLNRTCAALVTTPAFLEVCNEPFKNGIDVGSIVPPVWGPYLRDSGYYSEIQTWQPGYNLDFISYHSGRDKGGLSPWPKWLIDLDDQLAVLLQAFNRPVVLKEPIGFAEQEIPGRRSSDPACAFRLGLTAAYGGVLFHFDDGIDCNSPRPVQRACEEAYFAGVTGGLRR